MTKKIELFTFIYNDEDMLPFFLDHYSFVDRMTFIDSGSTDKTHSILKKFATPSHPAIRIAQTGLDVWDHEYLHGLRNSIWQGSTYDLVLFPDCDEIFYYPTGLGAYLRKTKFDIYEMEGFDMVADRMPRLSEGILSVRRGVKMGIYNKSTIFNPRTDIKFLNAHIRCSTCTNIDVGTIKLLHYRSMGLAMMRKRNERERLRLPAKCRYRAALTEREILERYKSMKENSKVVI